MRQNISVQWREYLVGDIQDILKGPHNFYESNFEIYKETALKRIITRFELILHTYLREFVQNSINDWVWFIKSFTLPDYEGKQELWRYAEEPMIIIHLHVNQPKRSKEKKERKGKNDRDSPNKTRDEEEEKLYVDYKPTLAECSEFFTNAFDMMIHATNHVKFLEGDLMPFLKKKNQEAEIEEEEESKGGAEVPP